MKKAQELSLTTVVIAAIALLVLIVLSVIFVGRMAGVSSKSKDCQKLGGSCLLIADGPTCNDQGMTDHANGQCLKDGPDGNRIPDSEYICCLPNID